MLSLINNNNWTEAINNAGDDIDKKIVDGNNILHLACMRGNEEVIYNLIKKSNVLLSNNEGNNMLHLLIKNGWNDIALNIAKNIPELIGMINNRGQTSILLSVDRIELFTGLLNLLGKNKLQIIDRTSMLHETIIIKLMDHKGEQYFELLKKILKMGANTEKPIQQPPLIYAIEKKYNNVAKLLLEYGADVNIKDISMYSPINIACLSENLEIVDLLLEFGVNIDYGGPENDYLPINILINKKYYHVLEILMKKIKNYEIKDRFMNTYLHYLLSSKLEKDNNIPENIITHFLKHSKLDVKNIDGATPLNILLKLPDWKKYMNIIEKNDITLNINDTATINDFDENKYLEITEKRIFNNRPIKLIIDDVPNLIPVVKLGNIFGLFNSDGIHNVLYTLYMLNCHKNFTVPHLEYNKKKHMNDMILLRLQDIPYDGYYKVMYSVLDLYYRYFYEITPHIILWKSKLLHYFHPQFEKYLKNAYKDDKRFIMLKITLVPSTSGTHANIVIIDKKDNTTRRFEPYGKSDILDGDDLDRILFSTIKKVTNNKMKYYCPDDYLNFAKFQTVSGDTYDTNKKLGDPVGYCLAWCFWYLELKLNNPDIEEKKLINDTLDEIYYKYKNEDNPFLIYIRAYAKKLDENKNELLGVFGVDKKYFYDINPKSKNAEKIVDGFAKIIDDIK